jgi:hypothetical protein
MILSKSGSPFDNYEGSLQTPNELLILTGRHKVEPLTPLLSSVGSGSVANLTY